MATKPAQTFIQQKSKGKKVLTLGADSMTTQSEVFFWVFLLTEVLYNLYTTMKLTS